MRPENGVNLERVLYFPLEEYINRITLSDEILMHSEETEENFRIYIDELKQYCKESINDFLVETFSDEIVDSNRIENHLINPKDIRNKNIFLDSTTINHRKIKELHRFVTDDNEEYEYRNIDAWVRKKIGESETIYWYGADPKDIFKFVDDFIRIYGSQLKPELNNSPFIKSALFHLLIMRIHPFKEGNGRVSRMIQNMKFTETIAELYGYDLKISPLHLSKSILINKKTYYKRINDIYFDLTHNANDAINDFFDFILYMFDEQIFYMINRLRRGDLPLFKDEYVTSDLDIAMNKKRKR